MKPGILASGVRWPQHDEERPVRLTLSSANRVRIEALTELQPAHVLRGQPLALRTLRCG